MHLASSSPTPTSFLGSPIFFNHCCPCTAEGLDLAAQVSLPGETPFIHSTADVTEAQRGKVTYSRSHSKDGAGRLLSRLLATRARMSLGPQAIAPPSPSTSHLWRFGKFPSFQREELLFV